MKKILLVYALLFVASSLVAEKVDINGMVCDPDEVISSSLEELTAPIPGEGFIPVPSVEVEYKEVWFGSEPDAVVLVPVDEYEEYMEKHNGSPQPLPEPLPEPDEGYEPSEFFEPLWGDDVLIDGTFTMAYPSVAVASNGDIYAACQLDSTYDYIRIYRSTDGGSNWSVWDDFFTPVADRRRPHLLINDVGSTEYIFMSYDIEFSSEFNVWTVRSPLGASASWVFEAIDNTAGTEDINAVIDHDRYTPYYMYAAFQRNTGADQGDIRAAISRDEASTWETSYSLNVSSVGEYRDPQIGYGYGGNVYVTWWLDGDASHDDAIRLSKGTSRPDSANDWTLYALTLNNDGIDDREPSVAATSSGNNVEVLYRRDVGSAWDIFEHYSSNGGTDWNQRRFAYGGTDNKTRWPRLCVDHGDNEFYLTWRVTYNSPPNPERYAATHTATPGSWAGADVISDLGNEPSFSYPPAITVRRGLSSSDMPWIVWFKYDTDHSFYFDGAGRSGVEEGDISVPATLSPNPSNGIAKLSYNIEKAGNVRISLYNVAGRLIENLLNESKSAGGYSLTIDNTGLPSGVYFIQISSPDGVSTKSMTVVK